MVSKATVDEIEMMYEMGMDVAEIADSLELDEAVVIKILDSNIVEGD
jgi:DNA-binding transcriptional regulator LsrR (DeoR family)